MEGAVALVLALLSIPFILPLVSFLIARKLRARVDDLEARVVQQNEQISRLTIQLNKLKQEGVAAAPPAAASAAARAPVPPVKVSEPACRRRSRLRNRLRQHRLPCCRSR